MDIAYEIVSVAMHFHSSHSGGEAIAVSFGTVNRIVE